MLRRVLVVGAGVSGLTCAVRLLERGHEVVVVADRPPDRTVSAVAGALWYLPRGELLDERAVRWARASYDRFLAMSADLGNGIVLRESLELLRSERDLDLLREALPGFRMARTDELRAGATDGFVAGPLPVLTMETYLDALVRRVRAGARMLTRRFVHITEVIELARRWRCDAVVNASGLGARELVRDRGMTPVRGQLIRLEPIGLETVILDEEHPGGVVYLVPRRDDLVCGGIRAIGEESEAHDREIERAILERCQLLEPRICDARRLSRAVGIRPGRGAVRVELEEVARMPVVHDYGHGGNGVTLSWGCADDVADLLA